ncbi:MAG: hypothetical protein HQM16_14660 [Deltaproteobacteria bacterium]|nr:hypothetical protein [Deltaproteobacteria bacterium]
MNSLSMQINTAKKILAIVIALGILPGFFWGEALAFDDVAITGVTSMPFEGPIHHGLSVQTAGIKDPNLSAYEVQVKIDDANPFRSWQLYSGSLSPSVGGIINIPYRNGVVALVEDTDYCVRIRALFGSSVTSWATQCGLSVVVPATAPTDADGDGIDDSTEYALGLDPNNRDTDLDGFADYEEMLIDRDPLLPLLPQILVRTTEIDFGFANHLGTYANQHQYIELENVGVQPARIKAITADRTEFRIGAYPTLVTHLPPDNKVYVPVSFLPKKRGLIEASIFVQTGDGPETATVAVRGTGADIPNCRVYPEFINFGTVDADDQNVRVEYLTISNQYANADDAALGAPLAFTIKSTVQGITAGTTGFVLPKDKTLRVPVLFQHPWPGNYEGRLELKMDGCGNKTVKVKGRAR